MNTKLINSVEELNMYRTARQLFTCSRGISGTSQLSKNLRLDGFETGRYPTRSIMRKLKLHVKQRQGYKVTKN